jgi:hypothetical protein
VCENTLSADVPSGINQITTNCTWGEGSGDWLDETESSWYVKSAQENYTEISKLLTINYT